jgi:predicted amidophosphoribosyltransferase
MQQAFYIRKPHLIAKRSIILVDDVLTTGSTCEAATVELLKAGAASVVLLTFAAAPPPGA